MEYVQEVLDRRTGELVVISDGDWITITELGDLHGVGKRQVRTILREMGFLHVEGGNGQDRHRLTNEAVERGWGRRIERRGSPPFDVVSPAGQAWIAERWDKTVSSLEHAKSNLSVEAAASLEQFKTMRRQSWGGAERGQREMSVEEMVYWLADHFGAGGRYITQAEIASVLSVSQPLVARHLKFRSERRNRLLEQRKAFPSKPQDSNLSPKQLSQKLSEQPQRRRHDWVLEDDQAEYRLGPVG